jgi:low affinity Fe/Cu permease
MAQRKRQTMNGMLYSRTNIFYEFLTAIILWKSFCCLFHFNLQWSLITLLSYTSSFIIFWYIFISNLISYHIHTAYIICITNLTALEEDR